MEIEDYVRYRIEKLSKKADGKPDHHGPKTILFLVDMPRWQWEQRGRTLSWISARFQYFNPKEHLSTNLSFFDRKTGLDVGYKSALGRLSSAKGQVTKIENLISQYVAGFKPTLFVRTPEETDAYRNAVEKLNQKKALLWQAEQDVAAESEAMRNSTKQTNEQ